MNIPTQFTDDSHYQNTIIKHSRRLVGYFNYGTDEQRYNIEIKMVLLIAQASFGQ